MSSHPESAKEITRAERGQIVQPQEWMRTQRQVALVRETLAPSLNDNEFEMFLGICKATGLNPIMRQLHAIKRKDKNSRSGYKVCFQVGIDGYRLIADRTGLYAGSDVPVFDYPVDNKLVPTKATVTVYKIVGGQRVPFTAAAYWQEYYPGKGPDGFMWDKFPHGQLAKCAEALALRKAFPAELSGLYAEDELHQSEEWIEAEQVQIQQPRRASEAAQDHPSTPAQQPQPAAKQPPKDDSLEGQPAAPSNMPNFDSGNWRQVKPLWAGQKETRNGKDVYRLKFAGKKGETWASTFSETHGEAMVAAYRDKRAIWVELEANGQYIDVVNVWEGER